MRKFLTLALAAVLFAACANTNDKMTKCENDSWDKVFPLSEKVSHKKVSFQNQYGIPLVGDLYMPKEVESQESKVEGKYAAIAVSGPFGATKEQSSGLYAMKMAERGFIALAFDPSFTGESGPFYDPNGSSPAEALRPRRTASPDINTEDFMAAVDYLSKLPEEDAERIGIIGICGWGGIALNAAAADPRIKATVASTMYDMTRVAGNGYFDSADSEEARHEARVTLAEQRLQDPAAMAGGVVDPLPDDAPKGDSSIISMRFVRRYSSCTARKLTAVISARLRTITWWTARRRATRASWLLIPVRRTKSCSSFPKQPTATYTMADSPVRPAPARVRTSSRGTS